MSENCQMVVFSNKAYNAIIRESFDKDPVETGGILLGHVLDNGIWIVMEVLPPGIHCIFERAYFEYDDAFVNYLAQSVANQYKIPLELLGLWHRHPGSMDYFSSTDDQTNSTFAAQNRYGVISGLVNIDPQFRMTMYHLSRGRDYFSGGRPAYETIPIEVGDDIIPDEYFELRYYDGDNSELHPRVERTTRQARETHITSSEHRERQTGTGQLDIQKILDENMRASNRSSSENEVNNSSTKSLEERVSDVIRFFQRNRLILILILFLLFGLSLKVSCNYLKNIPDTISEWIHNKDHVFEQSSGIPAENLFIGQTVKLSDYLPAKRNNKDVTYYSNSESILITDDIGEAVSPGEAIVSAQFPKGDMVDLVKFSVAKFQYELNHKSLTLSVGDEKVLSLSPNPSNVQWQSEDTSIATIDPDGRISAISSGETIIRALISGKDEASCSIQITDANIQGGEEVVTSYTLSIDNGRYNDGGTLTIGASHILNIKTNIPPQELSCVIWESSDPSVASIESNGAKGKIHAIKAGNTIMTVKYHELSSSWKLTVKEK